MNDSIIWISYTPTDTNLVIFTTNIEIRKIYLYESNCLNLNLIGASNNEINNNDNVRIECSNLTAGNMYLLKFIRNPIIYNNFSPIYLKVFKVTDLPAFLPLTNCNSLQCGPNKIFNGNFESFAANSSCNGLPNSVGSLTIGNTFNEITFDCTPCFSGCTGVSAEHSIMNMMQFPSN
jgi:hypothetical protein